MAKVPNWEVEAKKLLLDTGESQYYLLNGNIYKRTATTRDDAFTYWYCTAAEWEDYYTSRNKLPNN